MPSLGGSVIEHKTLLPLTYTKPVAELRVGILKIKEKCKGPFINNHPFTHSLI